MQDMGFTIAEGRSRCKHAFRCFYPGAPLSIQLIPERTVAAATGYPTPSRRRIIGDGSSGDYRWIRRPDVHFDSETARWGPIACRIPLLDIQDMGFTIAEGRSRCKRVFRCFYPGPRLSIQLMPERTVAAATGYPTPSRRRVIGDGSTGNCRGIRWGEVHPDSETARWGPIACRIPLLNIQDVDIAIGESIWRRKGRFSRLCPGTRFRIQLMPERAVAAATGRPAPGRCRVIGDGHTGNCRWIRQYVIVDDGTDALAIGNCSIGRIRQIEVKGFVALVEPVTCDLHRHGLFDLTRVEGQQRCLNRCIIILGGRGAVRCGVVNRYHVAADF